MRTTAWPAPSPGAPLEAEGNLRPREMTVHDGIRLIGLLGSSSRTPRRPYYGRTRGGIHAFALWTNCRGVAAQCLQYPGRRAIADPDDLYDALATAGASLSLSLVRGADELTVEVSLR